ncbi:MAG: Phosphoenolpyruvate-protein phosphotransferase [Alphaproteobacteria bacterium MarineAlpha3_Bin5]|nr:phosphoenolpyruvate--protein phosphotransferase [Magnetovibrio sp.]PPR77478.1 MAG: Phosphoenolpyruvate-protein phosphotransferase [Alphaproteobacteria bacterium MarineAlpha3_Bin5]
MAKDRKNPKPVKVKESCFDGFGVSAGIAFGKVYPREGGVKNVSEYHIAKSKIGDEQKRLSAAVESSKRQLRKLSARIKKFSGAAGEEISILFDAYHTMLKGSRLVRGAEERILKCQINAEAAVQAEIIEISSYFENMEDSYIAARIDDVREVGYRIIHNLTDVPDHTQKQLPRGAIVVARSLSPPDIAQIDPNNVRAIVAEFGGADGHTAIMARALGIPTVLGASEVARNLKSGSNIIVDGTRGRVVINPERSTVVRYESRRHNLRREVRRLDRLRNLDCCTRDGVDITLQANLELPIEMKMVNQSGASGIGLLRSEFLFMNRENLPSEEEQFFALKDLVQQMNGRPITIRTFDAGGEKSTPILTTGINEEAMSALGLRGIRLSLEKTEVLETQFRAILRVARYGHIRILLPMVTTPSEVIRTQEIMVKQARRLRRRGEKIPDKLPPIGVMIEVPGAALAADGLSRVSDFFAIGSNDLTMYTLAIDRANRYVAHMFDSLHPAVLRLIQFSAEAAFRARIPVSICGEMAGDPRFTALLVGMGFRDLSMAPSNILRVKNRVRGMDSLAASHRAHLIMDQTDKGRITMLLDDFNALA